MHDLRLSRSPRLPGSPPRRRRLRLEMLEDRTLLASLYWLGTAGGDWDSDSWTAVDDGTADPSARPVSDSTLIISTASTGFNAANGFAMTNSIAGLTGL